MRCSQLQLEPTDCPSQLTSAVLLTRPWVPRGIYKKDPLRTERPWVPPAPQDFSGRCAQPWGRRQGCAQDLRPAQQNQEATAAQPCPLGAMETRREDSGPGKGREQSIPQGPQSGSMLGTTGPTPEAHTLTSPQYSRDTLKPKTLPCSCSSLFSRVLFPAPDGPLSTTGLGPDMPVQGQVWEAVSSPMPAQEAVG